MIPEKNDCKKVAFVCYGGAHAEIIFELVEELRVRRIPFACLALTTGNQYLKDRGVEVLGFSDLLVYETYFSRKQIVELGLELIEQVDVSPDVGRDETIAYLGWNMFELISRFGRDVARAKYKKFGRAAFQPIRPLQIFLEKIQPNVLCVTNSPRAEKAAIAIAQALGIPSLAVVDLFPMLQPWLRSGELGAHVCVFNNLIGREFSASVDLSVTGNPAISKQVSLVVEKRKIFDRKRQNDSRHVVFLMSRKETFERQNLLMSAPSEASYCSDINDKIISGLNSLLKGDDGFKASVRPHPAERHEYIGDRLKLGMVECRPEGEALADCLAVADFVVFTVSTAGLIASLSSIPTVRVKGSMFDSQLPFEKYFSFSSVVSCDHVKDAILGCQFYETSPIMERNSRKPAQLIADKLEMLGVR